MFMLYFTWSYCKQLASNVKLATGKYKIISRQLGSFEVLFSRPAEVSVTMGEWATVNFCPWLREVPSKIIFARKQTRDKQDGRNILNMCYKEIWWNVIVTDWNIWYYIIKGLHTNIEEYYILRFYLHSLFL
jgi:hypothetical protein